jgi:hypothetical protein
MLPRFSAHSPPFLSAATYYHKKLGESTKVLNSLPNILARSDTRHRTALVRRAGRAGMDRAADTMGVAIHGEACQEKLSGDNKAVNRLLARPITSDSVEEMNTLVVPLHCGDMV